MPTARECGMADRIDLQTPASTRQAAGVCSSQQEDIVAYRAIFSKGNRTVASRLWPCSLEAATAHALAQYPLQHTRNGATSVTVVDARTGAALFQFADTDMGSRERRRISLGLPPRGVRDTSSSSDPITR